MKIIIYVSLTSIFLGLTGFHSCQKEAHQEVSEEKTLIDNNITKRSQVNPFIGLNQEFDNWFINNSFRLESITRDEILSFEDEEVQVMIFNVIPASRKAHVWREKYDELLESDLYNQQQKDFIESLRSIAIEEFYSNSQAGEKKIDFFNSRREFGYSLFEDAELRSIMINLDNISPAIGGGGGGLICKCSGGNDWCDVPVSAGNCSGSCDNPSAYGCGTLWRYACNGRYLFSIEPIDH